MSEVTTVTPVDIGGVRDPGMQAVILLAASLGWNVMHKQNQPVVITARDGTQRRLPTNTSIRMGVFQSALSTVMAHTDPDVIASVVLIDAIVKMTKVPKDHERRLRLAIGETVAQHRERISTEPAVGSRDPQAITTRIDEVLDAHFREVLEWQDPPKTEPVRKSAVRVPADGGEHGDVVTREPFLARKSVRKGGGAQRYISKSSLIRTWTDGYVDYECVVCGIGLKAPRSLGAHRMQHINRGETERAGTSGEHVLAANEAILRQEETVPVYLIEEPEQITQPTSSVPPDAGAGTILHAITALVAPELIKERDALRDEVINLRAERDTLAKNLQALKDLIGGL